MKLFLPFLLLIAIAFTGCDKSDNQKTEEPLPVTNAVKTGDWMVFYFENNTSIDMGLTFLKFSTTGSLVATKDGIDYNGTWAEANTGGNNTLTINITTTDTKLQRANRTWQVTNVSEYY